MRDTNFYSELAKYTKDNDNANANKVVMRELAIILSKNREDFIEVLRNANIVIPDNAPDTLLINAFVENAPDNRKLLLGASFLVNHSNRKVGFDGEDEVSDVGVKATYKVMYNHFDASQYEDTSDILNEDYANADGEDFSYAGWGEAIKSGLDLGKGVVEKQRAKNFGSSDTLAKQQDARKQLMQTVMSQKQQQADEKAKAKERSQKTTKTLLIVGGSLLGIALIVGVIYAIKKK